VVASLRPAVIPAADRGRARLPDETGFIERAGIRVAWDRYGDARPTILLLPSWSVVYSRLWKLQVAYLARHFRVLTYDGRGNGRSDRPASPQAYAETEFVDDALAILDATGTDRAVIAGLSMGGGIGLRMAAEHPDRVLGAVFIAPAIQFDSPPPHAVGRRDTFEQPQAEYEGWDKYNAHHWRTDWPDFAAFFSSMVFSEPHSTKHREDFVEWMLQADPETIIATRRAPYLQPPDGWVPDRDGELFAADLARRVACPSLVIHGDGDEVVTIRAGRRMAELLGAPLVTIAGGGHSPVGRDPVMVNLLLRAFAEQLAVRS
jgi:pimeloyl-ACP methyl ester carboxylesterase